MSTFFHALYFITMSIFGLEISHKKINPILIAICTFIYVLTPFIPIISYFTFFIAPICVLTIIKKENYFEAVLTYTLFTLLLTLSNLISESRIFAFIFLISGYFIFYKVIKNNPISLSNKNKIIVSILFLVFDFLFQSYTDIVYSEHNFTQVYFLKKKRLILFISIFCILFLLYFVVIILSQYKAKIENKSYKEFIQIFNMHMSHILEEQKQSKELVHDIRNNLADLKILSTKEEYDQLESQINTYLLKYAKTYTTSVCSNPYVNAILNDFIKINGSHIDFKISIPENIDMDAQDLSLLLMCLLDSSLTFLHVNYTNYELAIHAKYKDDFSPSFILINTITNKYKGQIINNNKDIKIILFTE